jgi:hypothetical protein
VGFSIKDSIHKGFGRSIPKQITFSRSLAPARKAV